MPQPWEVTEFLSGRFAELGVTGMVRNHSAHLAVLLVTDGFVVWSNGATMWWLRGDAIAVNRISTAEELWRLAYARYRAVAGDAPYEGRGRRS